VRPVATRVAMIAASTVPRPAGVICAEPASLAVIYASVTPARVVSFSPALIHGIAPLTAHTQAHKATMSKRRWPKDSAETDKNWYRERCTSLRSRFDLVCSLLHAQQRTSE